mmetsp:Transcript_5071/g.14444  ORF Transcript_5071/g.14444 Transcript_5071/m.14444 type:complete len:500 (+) Transcript_5071:288-1787(+)
MPSSCPSSPRRLCPAASCGSWARRPACLRTTLAVAWLTSCAPSARPRRARRLASAVRAAAFGAASQAATSPLRTTTRAIASVARSAVASAVAVVKQGCRQSARAGRTVAETAAAMGTRTACGTASGNEPPIGTVIATATGTERWTGTTATSAETGATASRARGAGSTRTWTGTAAATSATSKAARATRAHGAAASAGCAPASECAWRVAPSAMASTMESRRWSRTCLTPSSAPAFSRWRSRTSAPSSTGCRSRRSTPRCQNQAAVSWWCAGQRPASWASSSSGTAARTARPWSWPKTFASPASGTTTSPSTASTTLMELNTGFDREASAVPRPKPVLAGRRRTRTGWPSRPTRRRPQTAAVALSSGEAVKESLLRRLSWGGPLPDVALARRRTARLLRSGEAPVAAAAEPIRHPHRHATIEQARQVRRGSAGRNAPGAAAGGRLAARGLARQQRQPRRECRPRPRHGGGSDKARSPARRSRRRPREPARGADALRGRDL